MTLKHLRIFDVAPGNKRWHFSAEFDGCRELAIASPTRIEAGEWSNVRALLKDAAGPSPSLLAWIEPGAESWSGPWPSHVPREALLGSVIIAWPLFAFFALGGDATRTWPAGLLLGGVVLFGAALIRSAVRKTLILSKFKKES